MYCLLHKYNNVNICQSMPCNNVTIAGLTATVYSMDQTWPVTLVTCSVWLLTLDWRWSCWCWTLLLRFLSTCWRFGLLKSCTIKCLRLYFEHLYSFLTPTQLVSPNIHTVYLNMITLLLIKVLVYPFYRVNIESIFKRYWLHGWYFAIRISWICSGMMMMMHILILWKAFFIHFYTHIHI